MKKITILLLVILVIIGFLTNNKEEYKEDNVVKIGLSLPMSGPLAFLGESGQKAAQMALEDMGKTEYQYELIIEDDKFDPKETATVVNKFINIDKTLAMITFGSPAGLVASPLAEKSEVVHFAMAFPPEVADGDYNFIHWTPVFKEAELMAKEIVSRGNKKVSIVDTQSAGTLAASEGIIRNLEGTGVDIVTYDITNIGDIDFRTIAQKIKKAQPDLIILEQFSPEIEIMTRQLREIGVKIPVTSIEAIEWSSDLGLFEGMWFVSDVGIGEKFSNDFQKRYNDNPRAGTPYIYDIVRLLIETQENSDHIMSPDDLVNELEKEGRYLSKYWGEIKIDSQGFFLTKPSVRMVRNEKIVNVN